MKEIFGNAVKLPERIAIYVPGICGVDTAANTDMWVDHVATVLSELFGGATVCDASGCWMSDAAGLVRESVRIVYAYAPAGAIDEHGDVLRRLAEDMRDALHQEAVSVECGSSLYLV